MKSLLRVICVLIFWNCSYSQVYSQADNDTMVCINCSEEDRENGAILQVESDDKGMLIPRLTDHPDNPANSLLYYNTYSNKYMYFDSLDSQWEVLNPFDHEPDSGTVELSYNLEAGGGFFGAGSVPVGGIMMWHGTDTNNIPEGYAICDGRTVNNFDTPNLTDRFIVGYDPNDGRFIEPGNLSNKGNTTAGTGGVNQVTLNDIDYLPSHHHGGWTNSSEESFSHNHDIPQDKYIDTTGISSVYGINNIEDIDGTPGLLSDGLGPGFDKGKITNTYSGSSDFSQHIHNLNTFGKISPDSHENQPPYKSLIFIMRVE